MMDINKLIQSEGLAPCEAEAAMSDLDAWSEETARARAREEGLEMTEERLDAVCWLRDYYLDCGPPPNARLLLKAMEEAFAELGGRKYLYHLFPHGPITQGCRMAGLPEPAGNLDPSFGSVH